MADVLVDLGPAWGHVVPLDVLEHVSHIDSTTGYITVTCEFPHEEKRGSFRFKSATKFDADEIEIQKSRLLGFTNGLIPKEDVQRIMQSISQQTGVPFEEILDDPIYDITYIRQLWATSMGDPYMRFVLQYDPAAQTVKISEEHNDNFTKVPEQWSDVQGIEHMDIEEQILIFVHEVIYRMAEPLIPDQEGTILDPDSNIPMMGQGIRGSQQVDIAKMGPQNRMTLGGR